MPPRGPGDLAREIGRLANADWRPTVRRLDEEGRTVAGSGPLVRCAIAVEHVARSQQCRAQGRPQETWELLGTAAALLPKRWVRPDPVTGAPLALLLPEPTADMPADEALAVRLARAVWPDQRELLDLRERFAHQRMTPRGELVEARLQYERWVAHDPYRFYPKPRGARIWDDGVPVDCSRSVMVDFGTGIRQFANPLDVTELSTAPWQDIGAHRGLGAAALDELAKWADPVPWFGRPGTEGLHVPCAARRAWQSAQERRELMDADGDHALD